MADTVSLSDLSVAAYCPRKLHYVRQTEREPPTDYHDALELSRRYGEIIDPGADPDVADKVAVHPSAFRDELRSARESLPVWPNLVDPERTSVHLTGKDVTGRVQKVLFDPLAPSIVSPGAPPPEGVWHPQVVKAVGAAKALAWEREAEVDRAYVEYSRYGVIRSVGLTTRHKAAYRRTLRAVRSMETPPPRIDDDGKCDVCRFSEQCGVRTRSLKTLLTG